MGPTNKSTERSFFFTLLMDASGVPTTLASCAWHFLSHPSLSVLRPSTFFDDFNLTVFLQPLTFYTLFLSWGLRPSLY